MGLDMYLIKADGFTGKVDWNDEIGYWRKANQIHAWFVKNVQDGIDDCGNYVVTKEKAKELLELCKKVLNNKDLVSELLPSQSGFFFGSTDYNEWYFKDVEYTANLLTEVLEQFDFSEYDLIYSSSW